MTGSEYARLLGESPQGAHRALFDEYYKYVYTVVCGKLSGAPREDVEECVSDAFASLYIELESGKYTGELRGIVGTVAKRRAIDRYRYNASRRLCLISLDDEESAELPADLDLEENAENEQLRVQLLDAVISLGEPDATILVRRYFFGYSSGEIAEQLSMKSSAVRMRCSRALKRLKTILTDNGITL